MTAPLTRKSFTVEEYHKLAEVGILKDSDRVELINGEIITRSPIKSSHASTVDTIFKQLILKLHEKACIKGQNPIHIDDFSEPEPDIVVARYTPDNYYTHHPTPKDIHIVIEVADTTLEKDRTIKLPLYAKAGIPEYWIINIPDRQIEIHRQPKNGDYHFKQIISEEAVINCQSIELSLNFSDIFK